MTNEAATQTKCPAPLCSGFVGGYHTDHCTLQTVTNESGYSTLVYRDREGVYRWASNGAVPPADCEASYGLTALDGFASAKQRAAREIDSARHIAEYRAARAKRGYSAEELAEMRNAFGPGATVVDVFTGENIVL